MTALDDLTSAAIAYGEVLEYIPTIPGAYDGAVTRLHRAAWDYREATRGAAQEEQA